MNAVKHVWFWFTRYQVVAYWEGLQKTHWATSERDALEWVATYPASAVVAYGKRNKLLGGRRPA